MTHQEFSFKAKMDEWRQQQAYNNNFAGLGIGILQHRHVNPINPQPYASLALRETHHRFRFVGRNHKLFHETSWVKVSGTENEPSGCLVSWITESSAFGFGCLSVSSIFWRA